MSRCKTRQLLTGMETNQDPEKQLLVHVDDARLVQPLVLTLCKTLYIQPGILGRGAGGGACSGNRELPGVCLFPASRGTKGCAQRLKEEPLTCGTSWREVPIQQTFLYSIGTLLTKQT